MWRSPGQPVEWVARSFERSPNQVIVRSLPQSTGPRSGETPAICGDGTSSFDEHAAITQTASHAFITSVRSHAVVARATPFQVRTECPRTPAEWRQHGLNVVLFQGCRD